MLFILRLISSLLEQHRDNHLVSSGVKLPGGRCRCVRPRHWHLPPVLSMDGWTSPDFGLFGLGGWSRSSIFTGLGKFGYIFLFKI